MLNFSSQGSMINLEDTVLKFRVRSSSNLKFSTFLLQIYGFWRSDYSEDRNFEVNLLDSSNFDD